MRFLLNLKGLAVIASIIGFFYLVIKGNDLGNISYAYYFLALVVLLIAFKLYEHHLISKKKVILIKGKLFNKNFFFFLAFIVFMSVSYFNFDWNTPEFSWWVVIFPFGLFAIDQFLGNRYGDVYLDKYGLVFVSGPKKDAEWHEMEDMEIGEGVIRFKKDEKEHSIQLGKTNPKEVLEFIDRMKLSIESEETTTH